MRAAQEDLRAYPVSPMFQTDGAFDSDGTRDRLGRSRNVPGTSLAFDHKGQIRQWRWHVGSIAPQHVERQTKGEECLGAISLEPSLVLLFEDLFVVGCEV